MSKSERGLGELSAIHFKQWFLDPMKIFLLEAYIIVLFFGGAFASWEIEPWIYRFAFWQVPIAAGYVAFVLCGAVVVAMTGRHTYNDIRLAIVAGIPLILVGSQLHRMLRAVMTNTEMTLADGLESLLHYVIIVPLIIALLVLVGQRRSGPAAAEAKGEASRRDARQSTPEASVAAAKAAAPQPDLAAIAQAQEEVPLYLASEDHHVKIVFEDRVEIERATLKQLMERWQESGMQVHRSYWVRESAIVKRARRGRQMILELVDGNEVPVGRSYENLIIDLLDASRRVIYPDNRNGSAQGSAS